LKQFRWMWVGFPALGLGIVFGLFGNNRALAFNEGDRERLSETRSCLRCNLEGANLRDRFLPKILGLKPRPCRTALSYN